MDTIVNLNDTNNMDYEFYQLIVDKKLLSLSLCEFFTATEFDPNMYFSSTFWFALNQLNDNDWFEVTDDVIEKVGFKGDNKKSNQRTHLFDCLKHNFTEYIHYTFTLGKTRPITGRGGHNKKTLHMKRDSFKKLLMKVNTKNSDQIYDYLIAFENHVIKYMRYQSECKIYEVIEQNKKFTEIINEQSRSSTTPNTLNIIQENMLRNVQEQNEIYIMTSTELAQECIFKVGKSTNSFVRPQTMNTSHLRTESELYVAHVAKSYDNKNCENHLHSILACFRVRREREFFQCPFHELVHIVNSVCESFNYDNTAVTQLIEKINNMRKEDLIPFIPPRQNMSKRKLLLLPTNETKRSINDITRYFETK